MIPPKVRSLINSMLNDFKKKKIFNNIVVFRNTSNAYNRFIRKNRPFIREVIYLDKEGMGQIDDSLPEGELWIICLESITCIPFGYTWDTFNGNQKIKDRTYQKS